MEQKSPQFSMVMPKLTYKHIESLSQRDQEAILGRIPQEDLKRIKSALSIAWYPAEKQVALLAAVEKTLSPTAFQQFCQSTTLMLYKSPFIASIWEASVRIFGMTPASLVNWANLVLRQISRNVGTMEPKPNRGQKGSITLLWKGVPASIGLETRFFTYMSYTFAGFFKLTSVSGTVRLVSVSDDGQTAEYLFEWK